MATHLASIYGTEQDKVNCTFYHKIGACRHGDKCSRKHVKPAYSQTILCKNLYHDPSLDPNNQRPPEEIEQHFSDFYVDFFVECSKHGYVEEMVVCENNNDHLTGNVYCRFRYEEDASKARDDFNNRWYNQRPVYCELSPVTEFSEACCRQHESKECKRGGFCNFMHAKRPPRKLLKDLKVAQRKKGSSAKQQEESHRDKEREVKAKHEDKNLEDDEPKREKPSKRHSRDYTDSEEESEEESSSKKRKH